MYTLQAGLAQELKEKLKCFGVEINVVTPCDSLDFGATDPVLNCCQTTPDRSLVFYLRFTPEGIQFWETCVMTDNFTLYSYDNPKDLDRLCYRAIRLLTSETMEIRQCLADHLRNKLTRSGFQTASTESDHICPMVRCLEDGQSVYVIHLYRTHMALTLYPHREKRRYQYEDPVHIELLIAKTKDHLDNWKK